MGMINSRVLVLNRSYLPVNIVTAGGAITMVYGRDARFLAEDGNLYSWDEWKELPVPEGEESIGLAHDKKVRVPTIVRLSEFDKLPFRYVKFSRANIFARDENKCQYCGEKFEKGRLTLDHVCPKSRGGDTNWDNIATSCKPCNTKKGDRTPEEAKMPLKNKPHKPRLSHLKSVVSSNMPKAWKPYLKG